MFGNLETLPPDPILGVTAAFRARSVAAQGRPRRRRLPRRARQHAGAGRGARGRARAARRADHARPTSGRWATWSSTSASSSWRSVRSPPRLQERTATIQTVGGCGALRVGAELRPRVAARRGRARQRSDLGQPRAAARQLGPRAASAIRTTTPATPRRRVRAHARAPRAPAGRVDRAAARLLPQPDRRRPRRRRSGSALADVHRAAADSCRSWTSPTRASATISRPTCTGLRLLATRVPQLLLAISCSKNFGLYRERTGALAVIAENATAAARDRDAPGAHRRGACTRCRPTTARPSRRACSAIRRCARRGRRNSRRWWRA